MPAKPDLLTFGELLLLSWHVCVLAWNPTKNKLFQKEQPLQAEETAITLGLFYVPNKDDLLIFRVFLPLALLVWVLA